MEWDVHKDQTFPLTLISYTYSVTKLKFQQLNHDLRSVILSHSTPTNTVHNSFIVYRSVMDVKLSRALSWMILSTSWPRTLVPFVIISPSPRNLICLHCMISPSQINSNSLCVNSHREQNLPAFCSFKNNNVNNWMGIIPGKRDSNSVYTRLRTAQGNLLLPAVQALVQ